MRPARHSHKPLLRKKHCKARSSQSRSVVLGQARQCYKSMTRGLWVIVNACSEYVDRKKQKATGRYKFLLSTCFFRRSSCSRLFCPIGCKGQRIRLVNVLEHRIPGGVESVGACGSSHLPVLCRIAQNTKNSICKADRK